MADQNNTLTYTMEFDTKWKNLDSTMQEYLKKLVELFNVAMKTAVESGNNTAQKSLKKANTLMMGFQPNSEDADKTINKALSLISSSLLNLSTSTKTVDTQLGALGANVVNLNKQLSEAIRKQTELNKYIGKDDSGNYNITSKGYLQYAKDQASAADKDKDIININNLKPYQGLTPRTAKIALNKYSEDNSYFNAAGVNKDATINALKLVASMTPEQENQQIASIQAQQASLLTEINTLKQNRDAAVATLDKESANFKNVEVANLYVNSTKLQDNVLKHQESVAETNSIKEAQRSDKDIQTQSLLEKTNKSSNGVTKLVTSFINYRLIMTTLKRVVNEAVRTIVDLDKALTDQAIVSNLTRKEAWALVGTYQDLAKQTGFTITQIAQVATKYFQQGKTVKEVITLTEAAAKSAKVAGISATQAVDYLTTAINGFKLSANDAMSVSDKFAALAATSATDYNELAIALSKVASQANLAGMSMDYTLGLIAKGIETTREPAESIGTALKTVIARMREITDYGATLEDGTDINNVEKQLAYVNIQLRTSTGELRSTQDVLDDVGRKWDSLTDTQQASIAKALAGTRQQSRLIAMMQNYDRTLELVEDSSNSLGATEAQQVEYMQGLEYATNKVKTAYQALIKSFVNNDAIKEIANFIANIIETITKFFANGGWVGILLSLLSVGIPQLLKRITTILQSISLNAINRLKNEKEIYSTLQLQTAELLRQKALNQGFSLDSNGKWHDSNGKFIEDPGASALKVDEKTGANKFSKIGKGLQVATAVAGAIETAVSMIVTIVQDTQNAISEEVNKRIEKATENQANIYNNTKLSSTLKNLDNQFDTLNKKVIKTNEDLTAMESLRQQYIESLKTNESDLSLNNMTLTDLQQLSKSKQGQLSEDTKKQLGLMKNNLTTAQGSVNWTNLLTNTTIGASAGASAGGAIGGVAGGIGAAPGALAGAAIGGALSFLGTSIGNIVKQIEIDNNRKVIKEELKTDKGLAQYKYLYEANLDTSDMTGIIGKENAKNINSLFASLINSLDSNEMEKLLLDSGLTIEDVGKKFKTVALSMSSDLSILQDDQSTFSEKLTSVKKIMSGLNNVSPELAKQMKELYGDILQIGESFPNSLSLIDKFGFKISDLNDLLSAIEGTNITGDQALQTIGNLLEGGSFDAFAAATKDWSSSALKAAAQLITNGKTLQSVTESQNKNMSSVKTIRDTQAKWNSMSPEEQRSFLQDHPGLFQNKAELETFINGGDITDIIKKYEGNSKAEYTQQYQLQIDKSKADILAYNKQAKEYAQAYQNGEISKTDYDSKMKDIQNSIKSANEQIMQTEVLMKNIPNMYELTVDEVVTKQKEQIEAYKQMLEKQEKDLEDSLSKRKEAYQKYFDDINKSIEESDYAEKRDILLNQITKLSGGTDSTSQNKIFDLTKSLKELEKDKIKTDRENAQQAILTNIDDQLSKLKDTYDKLMSSNTALLSGIDSNTYANYLLYLQNSGTTQAEIEQWKEGHATDFFNPVSNTKIDTAPSVEKSKVTTTNNSITINGQKFDFKGDTELEKWVIGLFNCISKKTGSTVTY